jgi:hypothetical protein
LNLSELIPSLNTTLEGTNSFRQGGRATWGF